MNALSRRDLLSALLALAGSTAAPARANDAVKAQIADDVTRWLGPGAALIGRRYLQSQSAEADLDALADLLAERLRGARSGDLRRELSLAVQEDFGQDEVVYVDGWVLSRTEVRLCALSYLSG